jgi:tetratricopeptide (TPR) repeat protein
MIARMSPEEKTLKIQELTEKTAIKREELHFKAKEIKKDIEEAEEMILNAATFPEQLCNQVIIYYLFHERNKIAAEKYLQIAINQKAEPLYPALLAYAHTIDGGYQDDRLFKEALELLKKNPYSPTPETNELYQAFCQRYIALMAHRQSFNDALSIQDKNKLSNNAKEIITEVIKIQKKHCPNGQPNVLLELAESAHILGVINTKLGNLGEAKAALVEAAKYWDDFAKQTKHPHPIMYITQQSLGDLTRRLGNPDEALTFLNKALAGHKAYYGHENHLDIAKSFHFMGDAYFDKGDKARALANYTRAQTIKRSEKASAFMQKVSQEAMLKLLQAPQASQEFQAAKQAALAEFAVVVPDAPKNYLDANANIILERIISEAQSTPALSQTNLGFFSSIPAIAATPAATQTTTSTLPQPGRRQAE